MSPEAKKVLDSLTPVEPKVKKKQIPVRIRYNGEFVSVCSGKSLWRCAGHAKNALRNHFDHVVPWRERNEQLYQEVLNAVEFVPVEEKE